MRNTDTLLQGTRKRLKENGLPEFEKVFHMFNPALCYFARRMVNDSAIAQDIVTEVFLKLWQKRDDFPNIQSIKSFLYISTRNACLNHKHKVQYQARIIDTIRHLSSDTDNDAVNDAIRAEVLRQLYTIVNDLPTKCKEVMLLSYSEGLDCHQIARHMRLSIHTVRNQKTRGVHLVRNKFRSKEELAPIM